MMKYEKRRLGQYLDGISQFCINVKEGRLV
jgi:hypothetical protein